MGEPRPGDFPDPINVRTANVPMQSGETGKSGEYVAFRSVVNGWERVNTSNFSAQGPIEKTFAQAQQDYVSVAPNLTTKVAVFGPGSWFYGLANGPINPNDYVILDRTGTQFGFTRIRKVPIVTAALASNTLTVEFLAPHRITVGELTEIVGSIVPEANSTPLLILTVTNAGKNFTATVSGNNISAAAGGTLNEPVDANFATAQYIKVSGTSIQSSAILNDVCVFSILKGGQSVA